MHPGGVRSAMDLFDFEKSANLKHPSVRTFMLGHSRQCHLATANETIILGPLLQCPEAEMIYCQCTSE